MADSPDPNSSAGGGHSAAHSAPLIAAAAGSEPRSELDQAAAIDATESPPSAAQVRALSPVVVLLGWVSLLTDSATEMVFPLLANFIEKTLEGGKQWLGLIEGGAEAVAALVRLPSGWLSDRFRVRRPMILWGYGLSGLLRPLMAFAGAPWQALAIRLADRTGKGIRGAPRDALIADVTPPAQRGRAFGFHRAMDHAGAAIGPLLATAFLYVYPESFGGWDSFRVLCALTLIQGLVVIALLYWKLPREQDLSLAEPRAPDTVKPSLKIELVSSAAAKPAAKATAGETWLWGVLIALVVFQLGRPGDALLLSRTTDLGWPLWAIPALWFAIHVLKSTLNLWGGRLADRYTPRLPLAAGWLVQIIVLVGMGFATTGWQCAALWIFLTLYYGLSEPAEKLLISQLVGKDRRGTAFGWYALAQGLVAFPASYLFGFIWSRTPTTPWVAFVAAAVCGMLGLVLLLAVLRRVKLA